MECIFEKFHFKNIQSIVLRMLAHLRSLYSYMPVTWSVPDWRNGLER